MNFYFSVHFCFCLPLTTRLIQTATELQTNICTSMFRPVPCHKPLLAALDIMNPSLQVPTAQSQLPLNLFFTLSPGVVQQLSKWVCSHGKEIMHLGAGDHSLKFHLIWSRSPTHCITVSGYPGIQRFQTHYLSDTITSLHSAASSVVQYS